PLYPIIHDSLLRTWPLTLSDMSTRSRWATASRYPLTETIQHCVLKQAKRKGIYASDIVSDQLCDDILHRISPHLCRNSPVDILDLWPGPGLWSSKVNDFLRPRRHVLVEPDLVAYGPILKPIVDSKSCYEMISMNIYSTENWDEVFKKNFPEQGPSNRQEVGVLPRNDTLLVLARPPMSPSKKDHYTPGRWWSMFLRDCMRQTGLHKYGSVRVLASLPSPEMSSVLPRSVTDRKRPALLAESLSLHLLELASPYTSEPWTTWKRWESITDSRKRATERAEAQNIYTPPGREPAPLTLAPRVPPPFESANPIPYTPRISTVGDDVSPEATAVRKRSNIALNQLKQENQRAYTREYFAKKQLEIDALTQTLSHAAANPAESPERLQALDDQIAALQSTYSSEFSDVHFSVSRYYDRTIDDSRTVFQSNKSDDSMLIWERRPFEPLRIDARELFPLQVPRSVVYFEADPNSAIMQKLDSLPSDKRDEIFGLFDALSSVFGTGNTMSLAELAKSLFPSWSSNDVVKAIPSLARFVAKRLKPGSGPIPLQDGASDPTLSYQDNLKYDLGDTRVRCLPTSVIWDILFEYQENSPSISKTQFTRLLGGTLTSSSAGDHLTPFKRLN
ncbi:hypothetical protein NUU61_000756, partial [Penicillium alfredii]